MKTIENIILSLVSAGAFSAAVAADLYVSSAMDYGPADAPRYADLKEAVDAAQDGDTVWIQDGYVYDKADAGKEISSGNGLCRIIISKSITLRSESGDATTGEGATIRGAGHDATTSVGANAVRAIGVKAKNVVLLGLVLENGGTPSGKGGGGLFLNGASSAFVTNCVLRNSSTAYGGGVYISNNDVLVLSHCVVTNNVSVDFGGGVTTYGMREGAGALLDGCLIADNICANRGGGVSGGIGLVMNSCIVSNNVAINGGGAYSSYLTTTNCQFIGNAAGNGGGVSGILSTPGALSFVKTHFIGNRGITGGGVWDNEKTAIFESCTFVSNVAKIAGGVYGGTNYQSVVFTGNAATNGNGGAVYFISPATASGLTVTGNSASSNGGGLFMTKGKQVFVADSIVSENTSMIGAGAYAPSAVFTNVAFSGNRSIQHGGGIHGDSTSRPVLYGCVVSNNAAAALHDRLSNGGGLWSVAVFDSVIAHNTTLGTGGGAYDSILTRCRLLENTVTDSNVGSCFGAGAYKCIATNCVFYGNSITSTSGRYGSGCGAGAYDISGAGNTFFGNAAQLYGGGVNLVAGNVLIGSVFSNNTAGTSGGGVYGTGTLYNSLIVGNSVTNASGGASVAGAAGLASTAPYSLALVNCTVAGNTDENGKGRGGVYQVSITNTIVWGNNGLADDKVSAVSSCCSILTDGVDGNITSDPRLDADWRLKRNSPCRDAATPYAWMTDPLDNRSLDAGGASRVCNLPDMGAFEFWPSLRGFMLFVR